MLSNLPRRGLDGADGASFLFQHLLALMVFLKTMLRNSLLLGGVEGRSHRSTPWHPQRSSEQAPVQGWNLAAVLLWSLFLWLLSAAPSLLAMPSR